MNGYNRKSVQASQRGKANREEGDLFEQLIIDSCEYYRKMGIALIDKTPEPFRVTRPLGKGQFIGHFTKQAQPDFKGTLKGGNTIVFDAKATVTDRISLSALSETQLDDLRMYDRLGADAGVLMCFSFRQFVYMPIVTFEFAKVLNGHKYWTAEEAMRKGTEVQFTGTRLKFLDENLKSEFKI